MFDKKLKIWHNNEIKELKDASTSLLTHSLHYGSSVFEGIRAYETKKGTGIFKLKEHIDRLFYSASVLKMKIPYTKEELCNACIKVVKENNFKSCYLRPIIFFGGEFLGVNPKKCSVNVAIIAWKWGKYIDCEPRVKISKIRRISEQSLVADAKVSGHYINSILAINDIEEQGFDEALLLDHDGMIAEGPAENIFFIKNKELHTPKLGKILAGITRGSIITIAKEFGYEVIERDIKPEELNDFDSAFFTGTAAEFTHIKSIDEISFDTSLGKDLKEKFLKIIEGKYEEYNSWLTYCN